MVPQPVSKYQRIQNLYTIEEHYDVSEKKGENGFWAIFFIWEKGLEYDWNGQNCNDFEKLFYKVHSRNKKLLVWEFKRLFLENSWSTYYVNVA